MTDQAPAGEVGPTCTCDLLHDRAALAPLPLHRGRGHLEGLSGRVEGEVEFLVPVGGSAVIALCQPHPEFLGLLTLERARVSGELGGQAFRMTCSTSGIHSTTTSADLSQWALVAQLNGPIVIGYGETRAFRTVRARLNNFDYAHGDVDEHAPSSRHQRIGRELTVTAAGRRVTFRWAPDHDSVLTLLETRLVRSASVIEFSFEAWDEASEGELMSFADEVATAGAFVAGQLTNLMMLELLDEAGQVSKRIVPQPVVSPFTSRRVLSDEQIPRFFEECFSMHESMRRDDRWRKLSSYCGTVEACPTLEQKFMSVAIALEFLMRNSLIDEGLSTETVEDMKLGGLINRVRKMKGWRLPRHYEDEDRWRLLRNAVAHGNERPGTVTKDNAAFRQEFDKLKLLLYRLALLQLGYRGDVLAAGEGRHESRVDDFSEDRNTFRY